MAADSAVGRIEVTWGLLAARAAGRGAPVSVAEVCALCAAMALPMRLREETIGALNLFRAAPGPFDPADVRIGQALADVATTGLLNERNLRRSETLNEQLQAALNSRVIIEQAKGKLAERLGLEMDEAFNVLRSYARARNRGLSELSRAFIEGSEQLPDLKAGPPPSPQRE
jgi:GAF domain-containing protein